MSSDEKKWIAFLIYPGLTLLDLAGPLGVLQKLAEIDPRFEMAVVAEKAGSLQSDNRLTVIPDRTFAELPHPFALFVPGGGEPTLKAMSDPAIRSYVRGAAQSAEFVGSVCTGALILAAVGLLEGEPATTHWAFYRVLERLGSPYLRRRWVDNGRIINSAGVSAGIDMALYFVSRLVDAPTAQRVQRLVDYDPEPPLGHIDWERMSLMSRLMRGYYSIKAPFIAAKPLRLLRAGR
jgi:transcriptional regulator GlxA family with amidase domain